MSKLSLKSSTERKGKIVTQIVTFIGGVKKTFRGVKTETIEQSQFTKFETLDGRMVMIHDVNVLFVEVFTEEVK
jgi:hypothetical protein